MPSILSDYLSKNLGLIDLQKELQRLIGAYNKHTGRKMFLYAADFNKGRTRGIDVSLVQEDFYNIQDILRDAKYKKIDFYLETPGGSGEAAEEIAKFLRKKFDEVNFVIAGEAKSAGTILALSGDNIYMTDTGSLGPIDAQIKIGRSVVSAHDYIEWVESKRIEAIKNGNLNPFDAVMVAQISPGELAGVINSLEFAKDLVKGWLEQHKFKKWIKTQSSSKAVTAEMRRQRAHEVAEKLCDHTFWRTHGRSLKIDDLKDVLLIERIDEDQTLADIVYRINMVTRLILDSSTLYKLFYLEDFKLAKTAISSPPSNQPLPTSLPQGGKKPVQVIEFDIICPQCRKMHKVIGYMDINGSEIQKLKLPISANVQQNDILLCDNCKFAVDLKSIKNQAEVQTKRKITFK